MEGLEKDPMFLVWACGLETYGLMPVYGTTTEVRVNKDYMLN